MLAHRHDTSLERVVDEGVSLVVEKLGLTDLVKAAFPERVAAALDVEELPTKASRVLLECGLPEFIGTTEQVARFLSIDGVNLNRSLGSRLGHAAQLEKSRWVESERHARQLRETEGNPEAKNDFVPRIAQLERKKGYPVVWKLSVDAKGQEILRQKAGQPAPELVDVLQPGEIVEDTPDNPRFHNLDDVVRAIRHELMGPDFEHEGSPATLKDYINASTFLIGRALAQLADTSAYVSRKEGTGPDLAATVFVIKPAPTEE